MTKSYCVIMTTAGSREEAARLAEILVKRRLAACVQVIGISSWYTWQGAVTHEDEQLLLIKTAAELYEQVEAAVRENHSYEVPEVIQVPVEMGFDKYLAWIDENTGN